MYKTCINAMLTKYEDHDICYGQAKELVAAFAECLNGTYINYTRLTNILNTKASYDLLVQYISKINRISHRQAQNFVVKLKKDYCMNYGELFLCAMNRELDEVLN
mgnify:CR=1 FL=1